MSDALEFTGERFTPECVREIWYEHFHRYVFAGGLTAGKRVLDAACGEGYGAAYLAGKAASVTGVDLSRNTIEHAKSRYPAENLEFRVADCLDLPFGDNEFDCIVSFETLEHLDDQAGLLREFRRVLRPEGFLSISTPDKAVYSEAQQFDNEFHVRELYRDEFIELVSEVFPAHRLLGQKLLFHSAIWTMDPQVGVEMHQMAQGEVARRAGPAQAAMYYIALCADSELHLPPVGSGLWLFDDEDESVYRHYQHEIRRNMSAGRKLAERDQEIAELKKRGGDRGTLRRWWQKWF